MQKETEHISSHTHLFTHKNDLSFPFLHLNINTLQGIHTPLWRLVEFVLDRMITPLAITFRRGRRPTAPLEEFAHKCREGATGDGLPGASHEVEQVGQIVQANVGGGVWLARSEGGV